MQLQQMRSVEASKKFMYLSSGLSNCRDLPKRKAELDQHQKNGASKQLTVVQLSCPV